MGMVDGDGVLTGRFRAWLAKASAPGPVAADPLTLELFSIAARAAASDATILVTGPSGAGKEVMARYLHAESARRAGPFVALNCAALPDAMLEALLFGHERGAFTGAQGSAPGLFRAADGGTLFLDELGELPLALQAKLLRAVEQHEVLPLGATQPVKVDVRIVAATNRDLVAEVAAGRFRADLHWRLAVFPLAMPPLAARPLDIVPLVAMLLGSAGLGADGIGEAALLSLQRHGWPGNVRELANVLVRARILAGGGRIEAAHIRFDGTAPAEPADLADSLRHREAESIGLALAESGGRKGDAARRLGISERTLRYKLAAHAGRPRVGAGRAAGAMLQ
jgi:two-component system response regulator FlrC